MWNLISICLGLYHEKDEIGYLQLDLVLSSVSVLSVLPPGQLAKQRVLHPGAHAGYLSGGGRGLLGMSELAFTDGECACHGRADGVDEFPIFHWAADPGWATGLWF